MLLIIFCAVQHEEFCWISGMSEIKARMYVCTSCSVVADFAVILVVGYVLHCHLCSVLHFTFSSLVAKLLHLSKQNTPTVV